MSTIKVDKITGRTGSAGASSPLQFTGDTVTLTSPTINTPTIASATLTTPTIDSIKLTPGSAPSSPAEGALYYDSTSNLVKIYNGNAWENLTNTYQPKATGGIITSVSIGGVNYMVHTFLTSGTFTPASSTTVDYLVVAGGGGGGGGNHFGGGGGAGGFLTGTGLSISSQAYTITVGAAGVKGITTGPGGNGGNSVFSTITSTGGGGGGVYAYTPGYAGGSGGGGGGTDTSQSQLVGGTRTASPVQGNDGGDGLNNGPTYSAGGGGGAGAVGVAGSASSPYGGDGGAGLNIVMGLSATNSTTLLANASAGVVSGSYRYLAGGGGGGEWWSSTGEPGGIGGIGGGGNAHNSTGYSPTAGATNTGSGGGGSAGGSGVSGSASAGVVILRVPDASYSGTTTGSPTVATGVSGDTVMTFNASGSYTG